MKEPVKPVDLEAIKARVNEASRGPWLCEGDKMTGIMKIDSLRRVVGPEFFDSDGNDYCEVCEDIRHIGNAEFIANARQDIPALCDEVEALRERLKELNSKLERIHSYAVQVDVRGKELTTRLILNEIEGDEQV